MNKSIVIVILFFAVLVTGCKAKKDVLVTNTKAFVDAATPKKAFPLTMLDSTTKKVANKKWKLVFSDEFNDNKMDTTKWTVENTQKK
jgi:PBP1b-binding outer membrane lipoprotein LpoB